MKIPLDLKKHCIQTAIKRKYNQQISKYFSLKQEENPEIIESEIALLKDALEKLDFCYLRSTYRELQGGGDDEIILSANSDNQITIWVNNRIIHATHQNNELL